ncbi:MAG: NUDIX domain-containing protein [Flavobacteriales bacterium]|nr:NUDIX domain-containing protein [Flavobacteriales bacterium]
MKYIYYKNNFIQLSPESPESDIECISNPGKFKIYSCIDALLNKKNYRICLIGNVKKNLRSVKSYFGNIKAAGGLVQNQKNEILLIRRLGVWDLPKGKLEKDETKRKGAAREVEEECGISKVKVLNKINTTYHVYRAKNRWMLKTTYWFVMNYAGDETPVPQKEENIEEVRWIHRDRYSNDAYPSYPAIAKVLHQFLSQKE